MFFLKITAVVVVSTSNGRLACAESAPLKSSLAESAERVHNLAGQRSVGTGLDTMSVPYGKELPECPGVDLPGLECENVFDTTAGQSVDDTCALL